MLCVLFCVRVVDIPSWAPFCRIIKSEGMQRRRLVRNRERKKVRGSRYSRIVCVVYLPTTWYYYGVYLFPVISIGHARCYC